MVINILIHRGPDAAGIKWWNNFNSGLDHTRLSIIDLSPLANQPMSNDSGELWITYNGEIYNFNKIKKELVSKGFKFKSNSDTEIVIKSYEAWGEKCLEKLNGMFAFSIFDLR